MWAVLCGEEDAEGVIEDAQVRAVYDTNEAATDHVEYVNEVLRGADELAVLIYWVERWDVRRGFDPEDEAAL